MTTWRRRVGGQAAFGEWLFSAAPTHHTRLTASAAGHWFHDLAVAADVPGASLHRLHHRVATHLVGRGELLRAQQRFGRRDPSTTLRNYAHALPLEDGEVANDIDRLLNLPPTGPFAVSTERRPIEIEVPVTPT